MNVRSRLWSFHCKNASFSCSLSLSRWSCSSQEARRLSTLVRYLLDQWKSVTKLRLEWTSHQIQMRLDRERSLIDLIVMADKEQNAPIIQAFLAQRLRRMEGVRTVQIQSLVPAVSTSEATPDPARSGNTEIPSSPEGCAMGNAATAKDANPPGQDRGMACSPMSTARMMPMGRMMQMRQAEISVDESRNLLSIVRAFGGTENEPQKRIVVTIGFDSFMKGLLKLGGWHYSYACLVTSNGTYLAHTDVAMNNLKRLGGTGDPLEKKVREEMKTKDFGTVSGPGHPPDRVMGFYRVPTTDWYLVLVSKGSAVLAPIVRFRSNYLLAMVVSLVCVGLLIEWNTRPIAQSVTEIAKAAEEVERGDYSRAVTEDRADEIGVLKRRFNRMIRGLRERDLIERTFGRYVDRGVAAELLSRPELLQMGGTHQTVSILMADLRGFTHICEMLTPAQIITILNRHLSKMIEVSEKYRGIIVDFYGDSILVFFGGSEEEVPARALDAIKCGLTMQAEVEAASRQNQEKGLPDLRMGIGIHTGDVIVGNIGSEKRAKYGIVGSAVNETDRIQASASGGTLLISEKTYELLSDHIEVGGKCQACLKGLNGVRDL